MNVKAICPHCQKSYKIPSEGLGKQANCKQCGNRFALTQVVETEVVSPPVEPAVPVPPMEEAPTSFWGKLKSAGSKAVDSLKDAQKNFAESQRKKEEEYGHPSILTMPVANFLQGPLDLPPNTPLRVNVTERDVVFYKQRIGFTTQCDEVLRISLTSIKHLEVETAERMTMGRIGAGLVLAGPLGALFGGFGFKKKDKFLRIDFDDAGMETSMLFGGESEKIQNKILAARRTAARNIEPPKVE